MIFSRSHNKAYLAWYPKVAGVGGEHIRNPFSEGQQRLFGENITKKEDPKHDIHALGA